MVVEKDHVELWVEMGAKEEGQKRVQVGAKELQMVVQPVTEGAEEEYLVVQRFVLALVAEVVPNRVRLELQFFVLQYLGVCDELVVRIPKMAQGC